MLRSECACKKRAGTGERELCSKLLRSPPRRASSLGSEFSEVASTRELRWDEDGNLSGLTI